MSKEKVVEVYRDKDTIEKSFEILKDDLEVRPIYHRNSERVKGHIFMCFLALYIERYMKDKLGTLMKKHYWKEIRDELMLQHIVNQEITV